MTFPRLALGVLCSAIAGSALLGCLLPISGPYVDPFADLPVISVDSDDFEVTKSCKLKFDGPIVDANNDGVVHISTPDVVVVIVGVLQGSPDGMPRDQFAGIGVRVKAPRVHLTQGSIRGFKVGVYATGADDGKFNWLDVSDNFAQRLRSTPLAEDGGDWLWPHANDNHEWLTNYGAGLYIERSNRVWIAAITAMRGQNGIILDRVSDSSVEACDCSFLSGWGLALWRSCRNTVAHNWFDFCVRGYSHGVYNRGQDSAGILCFEQSSDNIFFRNSATHCGDGFFGFAGKEALGEAPAPVQFANEEERDAWYRGRGCNGNLIVDNDFSYAVAHGIELTFSFNNLITDNTCIDDAICGMWGGYSQHTNIKNNRFESCGSGAYGGERGGINIEHGSGNDICNNEFRGNACGVRLWWDDDAGLLKTPWAHANRTASSDNAIRNNAFENDRIAIELRMCGGTFVADNTYKECQAGLDTDQSSAQRMRADLPAKCGTEYEEAFARLEQATKRLGPDRTTRGLRSDLGGREAILIGPEGPYDWNSPRAEFDAAVEAMMRPYGPGVEALGPWTVRAFATTADPRTDVNAFRAAAKGAPTGQAAALMLPFGGKGPSDLVLAGKPTLGEPVAAAHLPADGFGLTATGTFTVKPGCWRIRVVSDDGIRVLMDGKPFIENWTWHAPAENSATFAVDVPTQFELEVEYFELTGHAVLQLFIEPCPAK